MEYLIEGIIESSNMRKCQNFIQKNNDIIEDVMLGKNPEILPLFPKIKNISDVTTEIENVFNLLKNYSKNKDFELLLWRYYCMSKPGVKLLVTIDSKENKNRKSLFNYTVDVSEKQIEYIKLQINFMKMKFNDFMEYLFDNADKFKSVSIEPFKESEKKYKLNISILENVKGDYGKSLFLSENFYELVEGSKIFLHLKNYDVFEKQLSLIYGVDLKDSIRTFFRLKFLKIYLLKNYSLLVQETLMLGGSYLLFAMGFRSSRDTDINSLFVEGIEKVKTGTIECRYDITVITQINDKYQQMCEQIILPENYYILFGFKVNNIHEEIDKRLKRSQVQDSGKALVDLIVLKYYLRLKIDLGNKVDMGKLIYRYKHFKNIINRKE